MPNIISISIEATSRGFYRAFGPGGVELVARSHTPLLDSARALLAAGANPDAVLEMSRKGSSQIDMWGRLGTLAELKVSEVRSPRFVRWKAFDGVTEPVEQVMEIAA